MRMIYTLPQIARVLGLTRQRAAVLHAGGRLTHDTEDQDGRPYWSRVPDKPPAMRPGRKQRD